MRRRMRRRKSNIITTIALILSVVMLTVLPLPVAEAANFTVSKSNVSIEKGKSSTITINAPTHTGRIDIISSNSVIATTNTSNLWVENDLKTITISANSVGTAIITIKGELYDSSTDEESEFSRTINVTVKAASSNTGGNTSNGNNTTGSSNTTGGTTGSTSSSQSVSSSNNTQKPSSNTSKPVSSNAGTTTSKPTNSITNNTNNSSTENVNTITEEVAQPEENGSEEIIKEEIIPEEVLEEKEEIDLEVIDTQIENADKPNVLMNFNSKTLIIVGIAVIAIGVTGVGIVMSKKILKK